MRLLLRLSLCCGLAAALLVGLGAASPRARGLGLDVWSLFGDAAELERHRREEAELTALLEERHAATAAKDDVLRALLDGRLTLTEAVAHYRGLTGERDPSYFAAVREHFPGRTEQESWARMVLEHARGLARRPAGPGAPDALALLEEEVRRYYGEPEEGHAEDPDGA